jgi:polysaccharide pyruvyl transferase WcaK-like protein
MEFDGLYGIEKTSREQYRAYLETLVEFVKWLLGRGYDVRLLTGDVSDDQARGDFTQLLAQRSVPRGRVIAEPITSTAQLLSQIAATEFVVATRFHNVVLSLLLNKPAIAISFHHKCSSLMNQMGLSEYCQDIQKLNGEKLAAQFCQLEKNADILKQAIAARAAESRDALEVQYRLLLNILRRTSAETSYRAEQEYAPVIPEREKP